MEQKITGMIHSTESFGSADGPGVRYIVFLQGCNMRCKYCHNPDTWARTGGTEKTPEEVLSAALRYRKYWGKNGGITVSGGEALLQIAFVTELFRLAKEQGVHTTLDTSGNPFTEEQPFYGRFEKLMQYTDLFLLDIKQIDAGAHKALTGQDNSNILAMAKCLSAHRKDMWIRHVLVPGYTDSYEQLTGLKRFIDTLGTVRRVEILPYHTLGVFKWKELGLSYALDGVEPPTKEQIDRARNILGLEP
ncbi:MAG: pyruvate formate lyase-activating protein [Clostridiaceae bacterium]|nr:pyruvate formate lyase-activating protein [Clostridiaceae bacterium]